MSIVKEIIAESGGTIKILDESAGGETFLINIPVRHMHVYKYIRKPADLDDIINASKDALKRRDPVLISLEQLAEKNPDEPMLLIGKKNYTVIILLSKNLPS